MLCFWSLFVVATIQGLFTGLWLYLVDFPFYQHWGQLNPFTFPDTRFAWFWICPGWVIDFGLSAIAAPLGLYGFARAQGTKKACILR